MEDEEMVIITNPVSSNGNKKHKQRQQSKKNKQWPPPVTPPVNPLQQVPTNTDLYVTDLTPFPIDGLSYYENFLSDEEQAKIIDIVDSNPWVKVIRRRQQFYGEVYYHTTSESTELQPTTAAAGGDHDTDSLSSLSLPISQFDWLQDKLESVPWRDRAFGDTEFPTQILVNEYEGMAGISSHFEDEDCFGPIICTISCICPVLMSLQRPREHTNDCQDLIASTKLLLEPKSLMVMAGDSRFHWRHGIARAAKHVFLKDGASMRRDIASYRRISLTIRHLKDTRRKVSGFSCFNSKQQTAFNTCQRYIDEVCLFYKFNETQKNLLISNLKYYGDYDSRPYHNWNHLAYMFSLLESYKAFIKDRAALILSVLFHDAIYDPKSTTNEEDSAALFTSFVDCCYCSGEDGCSRINEKIKLKVVDYILQTKTHCVPNNDDDKDLLYFIDFDMAVLGWSRDRYIVYAAQIRQEYIHVPKDVYCQKRAIFLKQTLSSSSFIFQTTDFQSNGYEERAKANLEWERHELSHGRIPSL